MKNIKRVYQVRTMFWYNRWSGAVPHVSNRMKRSNFSKKRKNILCFGVCGCVEERIFLLCQVTHKAPKTVKNLFCPTVSQLRWIISTWRDENMTLFVFSACYEIHWNWFWWVLRNCSPLAHVRWSFKWYCFSLTGNFPQNDNFRMFRYRDLNSSHVLLRFGALEHEANRSTVMSTTFISSRKKFCEHYRMSLCLTTKRKASVWSLPVGWIASIGWAEEELPFFKFCANIWSAPATEIRHVEHNYSYIFMIYSAVLRRRYSRPWSHCWMTLSWRRVVRCWVSWIPGSTVAVRMVWRTLWMEAATDAAVTTLRLLTARWHRWSPSPAGTPRPAGIPSPDSALPTTGSCCSWSCGPPVSRYTKDEFDRISDEVLLLYS